MSCGGRVYKGDTVTISVPFDVDDYSNLTITYTTIGGEKIVKTQEEVEIEDGFITYTFEPGELDLLPDGVIYYTIECEVNGVPNVDSTNTNLYLKTPAGYSGRTAEDIYQEGYEAGLEDCSGSTDCSSAVTEAYQSGYTEGYNQGQADCPECSGSSCNLQSKSVVVSANTQTVVPDAGYDGMDSVSIDATSFGNGRYHQGYEAGYDSGYEDAEEDYPRIQPQKNYTADTTSFVIVPNNGYDGMGKVNVNATPVFNQGYQSGYTAGQADCSGETPCDCTEAYQSGITYQKSLLSAITITANGTYYRPDGYESVNVLVEDTPQLEVRSYNLDENWNGESGEIYPTTQLGFVGFRYFEVNDIGYGQKKYDDGYQSGYTDGFQSGYTSSPNRSKITFKVRNATVIQADLTLLSFSVNGVPVEDVGAIFQTEEIQNFNYTTLWISGYTQPTSITGVVIEIKGENISGNSFNYNWNLFTEINGAEYEAASRSENYFDIIDENNKSKRIIYTYTGIPIYNEYSFEAGKDYGIEIGRPISYKEGMDSVIKSLLTENDTDLVIAYYYTSAYTNCLITGEYDFPQHDIHIDGNECISAMSINGGIWEPVQKYLHLQSGWTQIRFRVLNGGYRAMFSHFFTPSEECYMDALKVVSIPSGHCVGEQMFRDNEGLRVLSTSCGILSCYGANNLNVVITHYTGNQRQFDYFPSNGVLFIPESSTADWASILPNWTHIEMF